ncbi:MAG: peroxiredoxin-like family protein, partial [Gammaproteobacteria bacterium]
KTQVDVMRRATESLIKQGVAKSALGVNDKTPLFELPNANGKSIAIRDLLDAGPAVLTFYRGGWCPYCNLELRAYQKSLAELNALGARLVAISPELPDSALSNKEKLALEFEVLSDVGNKVARQFGLVVKMSAELVEVYRQLGSDIPAHNGDDSWELPLPATYVIARNGKIVFAYVNVDYLQRIDPQEVIEELKKCCR